MEFEQLCQVLGVSDVVTTSEDESVSLSAFHNRVCDQTKWTINRYNAVLALDCGWPSGMSMSAAGLIYFLWNEFKGSGDKVFGIDSILRHCPSLPKESAEIVIAEMWAIGLITNTQTEMQRLEQRQKIVRHLIDSDFAISHFAPATNAAIDHLHNFAGLVQLALERGANGAVADCSLTIFAHITTLDEAIRLRDFLAARNLIRIDVHDMESGSQTINILHWPDVLPSEMQPKLHKRLKGDKWRKLRQKVFYRDKYTCQYCGERDAILHCDHITPISRGGSNNVENLTTACEKCNAEKHAKTPDEWLGNN